MNILPSGSDKDTLIKDTTTADFKVDVIDQSMLQPVLIDFWAPWCGPCRQLTPMIERAVLAAKGGVKLVKMNIDENPEIAGQLGVQSIPAVFAFAGGKPIDGFMGALPESEISAFIDKVIAATGGSASQSDEMLVDEELGKADLALEAGNVQDAVQIYSLVLQQKPDNLRALAGMANCYLTIGDINRATDMVSLLPDDLKSKPEIVLIQEKIRLAQQVETLGGISDLRRAVELDESNLQAKYDLALALGSGNADARSEATDLLVGIFKADREWREDGARKQLLKFFELWGATDPSTIAGRRKLSAVLFS